MAPRLASLDRVTLGILNNSKPNSLALQERVAERLGSAPRRSRASSPSRSPARPWAPTDLDIYAQEVGAVITAIGD